MVQIRGKYSLDYGLGRYDKFSFPLSTVEKEHLDILKKLSDRKPYKFQARVDALKIDCISIVFWSG